MSAFFKKAEVGKYPGTGRVYIEARCATAEEFDLVRELLSLVGVEAWDNPETFALRIDNHFDIEALIEKGVFSFEELGEESENIASLLAGTLYDPTGYDTKLPTMLPLADMKPIPEIFEKDVEQSSPFDDMREKEDGKAHFGDIHYLYRQAAKKYQREPGKLFRRTPEGKVLVTKEEETELLNRAQQGDTKARQEFLQMHMGLVYFVMFNMSRRFPDADQAELVQEGVIELNRCLDKYDKEHSSQAKFSTYAVVSLEWHMFRWIQENRSLIRLPINQQDDIAKVEKLDRIARSQHGAGVSTEKIAQVLTISRKDAAELLKIRDEVSRAEFVDIDEELGQEQTHETLVSDENIFESLAQEELKSVSAEVLDSLTPKEARVLRMYFGIDLEKYGHDMTLEEVGQEFGFSKERARHIIAKAIRKLKHPIRSDRLRSYLDPDVGYQYNPLAGSSHWGKQMIDSLDVAIQKIPTFTEQLNYINTLIQKREEQVIVAGYRLGYDEFLRMLEEKKHVIESMMEPR